MDLIKKIKHKLRRKPLLHVLSDSHGEAFYDVDYKSLNIDPSFCVVLGATASGLANPNSKTKALPIFLEYLKENVKKNDHLILEMGEVDCGFTIWLISEKKGISVQDQLKLTLDNYLNFLVKTSEFTKNPLIVVSAILPTIADDQSFGDVANLRKAVSTSQVERTALTLKFNRKLNEFCIENNHHFIDLDSVLLDSNKKIVKEEFKNDDKLDHHLNPKKLAAVLNEKLKFLNESHS